jgi:plastocyanin
MRRYVLTILSLVLLECLVLLVASCGMNATPMGANQVHMATHVFLVPSINIKQGESITLVNDAGLSHIVLNGSWVNGVAVMVQEPGAPTINTGQIPAGSSVVIGPFPNAGTYHVYCSLHVNMNLTVIVN